MCRPPNPFLMVTKRVDELNEPVTRVELNEAINAGIMWGRIGNDMVPIFEEHSTRIERGRSVEEWYALPRMERAMMIAVRRINVSMQNLNAEAEIEAARRKSSSARRD